MISSCGELERRKKVDIHASGNIAKRSQEVPSDSRDRGRRKRRRSRSGGRHESGPHSRSPRQTTHNERRETSRTPSATPPPQGKRGRRSSDFKIDENLRGRERRRAGVQEDVSADRKEHRRSRSPSRPLPHEHSRSPDYRRRRSLPNHYERREARSRHRDDEESLREQELRREDGRDRFHGADRQHASNRQSWHNSNGRLGGNAWEDQGDGDQIKFKGRGSMKYRERG